VKQKAKRIGWTLQLDLLEKRLWKRLRAQAIERAMGI
jgi:hypothetical protein